MDDGKVKSQDESKGREQQHRKHASSDPRSSCAYRASGKKYHEDCVCSSNGCKKGLSRLAMGDLPCFFHIPLFTKKGEGPKQLKEFCSSLS